MEDAAGVLVRGGRPPLLRAGYAHTQRGRSARCCCAGGRSHASGGAPSRRALGLGSVGAAVAGWWPAPGALRALELSPSDLEETTTVFLEFSMCPTATDMGRSLGSKTIFCSDPEIIGRVHFALYGNLVPDTVGNFVKAIESKAFNGTVVNKIYKGQYILAGKGGPRKFGEVQMPEGVEFAETNGDVTSPKAFVMKHTRPGTISLYLGGAKNGGGNAEGSGEQYVDAQYRVVSERGYAVDPSLRAGTNLQFAITTGPAPAPALDDTSVVFGRVTQGLEDVLQEIQSIPTFTPNETGQAFNKLASVLGDSRAEKARGAWGKPTRAVVITDTGIVT